MEQPEQQDCDEPQPVSVQAPPEVEEEEKAQEPEEKTKPVTAEIPQIDIKVDAESSDEEAKQFISQHKDKAIAKVIKQ